MFLFFHKQNRHTQSHRAFNVGQANMLAIMPWNEFFIFLSFICFIPLEEPSMLSCCLCVLCLSWRDQTSIFRGEETYCCLFVHSHHLSLAKSEHTSTKIQETAKIPFLYGQTWYLSRISRIIFVEKNCHVEKFQLSMYDNCGEIENFSTCGEISDVSTWQMWRNLKFSTYGMCVM